MKCIHHVENILKSININSVSSRCDIRFVLVRISVNRVRMCEGSFGGCCQNDFILNYVSACHCTRKLPQMFNLIQANYDKYIQIWRLNTMIDACGSDQAAPPAFEWLQDLPDRGLLPEYKQRSEFDYLTNHFYGFDAAIEQNNRGRAIANSCDANKDSCKWTNARGLYDIVPEEVAVRMQPTPATGRKRKLNEVELEFCTPKRAHIGGHELDKYQKQELLNYCRAHNIKIPEAAAAGVNKVKKQEIIESIRKATRQSEAPPVAVVHMDIDF